MTQLAPGINLSENWSDNDGDFVIQYNPTAGLKAPIEDLYMIDGDASTTHKVDEKIRITTGHITKATQNTADTGAFFISFASGAGYRSLNETVTPKVRYEILAGAPRD